ncbi:MAG TPA: methyltransferase domain-containing protein, partial [Sphingomicrobium sp.]|nr:methyltransferase domain-containing protein [Sphingomicrobium sp.]
SVVGTAECLPFRSGSFSATMSILAAHHWADVAAGVRELERVTTECIVILTYAPDIGPEFWLTDDYFPVLGAADDDRFLPLPKFCRLFSWPRVSVSIVPIPADCSDGFLEAFWARPHAYLDASIRANMSSFSLDDSTGVAAGLERLADDLDTGVWHEKWGHLLALESLDLGYRLVTVRK